MLMLDGKRLTYVLMKPDLPNVAANSRLKGMPEEYKAIAEGVLVFYGTYTLSGEELTITFESLTFPNWNGTSQKRTVKLEGDQLTLISNAPARGGTGMVAQVWSRAK
jgi:lipocalin-like protein